MTPSLEKSKRKTTKRNFNSAPDLPLEELRIKSGDMFPVSLKNIEKYKKQQAKEVTNKKKKSKPKEILPVKVDSKNVEKVLKKPIKTKNEPKHEQYPYTIKKNLVQLLGNQKPKRISQSKNENVTKPKSPSMPKSLSDPVKKTKNNFPKIIKSDGNKAELKKLNLNALHSMRPKLRENPKLTPRISPYSSYFARTKDNPALILYPQVTSFTKNGIQVKKNNIKKPQKTKTPQKKIGDTPIKKNSKITKKLGEPELKKSLKNKLAPQIRNI